MKIKNKRLFFIGLFLTLGIIVVLIIMQSPNLASFLNNNILPNSPSSQVQEEISLVIVYIDRQGNQLYSQNFKNDYESKSSIIKSGDDRIMLLKERESFHILKIDLQGNLIWNKEYKKNENIKDYIELTEGVLILNG